MNLPKFLKKPRRSQRLIPSTNRKRPLPPADGGKVGGLAPLGATPPTLPPARRLGSTDPPGRLLGARCRQAASSAQANMNRRNSTVVVVVVVVVVVIQLNRGGRAPPSLRPAASDPVAGSKVTLSLLFVVALLRAPRSTLIAQMQMWNTAKSGRSDIIIVIRVCPELPAGIQLAASAHLAMKDLYSGNLMHCKSRSGRLHILPLSPQSI